MLWRARDVGETKDQLLRRGACFAPGTCCKTQRCHWKQENGRCVSGEKEERVGGDRARIQLSAQCSPAHLAAAEEVLGEFEGKVAQRKSWRHARNFFDRWVQFCCIALSNFLFLLTNSQVVYHILPLFRLLDARTSCLAFREKLPCSLLHFQSRHES